MEPVFEERLSERQLDLSLAGVGALPAVEADDPDDLVDVVHNTFDNDRRCCAVRKLTRNAPYPQTR